MKDREQIVRMIIELEDQLEEKRRNIHDAGGQNLDIVNEPLFNQVQTLRWVMDIGVDEVINEIDLELIAKI